MYCNRYLKATKYNTSLSETPRESKGLVSKCWGVMEVCLSLIKDREVEKREIYRTQRTEQITAEIKGNLFIDIHQTQHSDMADTGE